MTWTIGKRHRKDTDGQLQLAGRDMTDEVDGEWLIDNSASATYHAECDDWGCSEYDVERGYCTLVNDDDHDDGLNLSCSAHVSGGFMLVSSSSASHWTSTTLGNATNHSCIPPI